MWKGAFFVHFLPAINSILLPNSNRMLHFPFSFSFSSFFLLFLSSHLPCPTLFARDPILFSPHGNTILTLSQLTTVQILPFSKSYHFPFQKKFSRPSEKICIEQYKVNGLIFHGLIWQIWQDMIWQSNSFLQ